ncbi:MAG: class I SAM-dependent methyltransferase [Alphaproteobacteria bacterium]|nr:class I SAM-dependent methyltransferase [Alphaproteobacteria bacterium]
MPDNQETKAEDELYIDFVNGPVGYRFQSSQGRNQALVKAVGIKGKNIPRIVDATAGLGRDSFLLAAMGAEVSLIERSPTIHQRLSEAMERAKAEGGRYAETISRMTLLHGNSITLLPELDCDVILVDPMHPPRHNSALVKKEMRILRDIVGTDPDQTDLMQAALKCAKKRVVLKWPMKAEYMQGLPKPSHQILGKNTRYDVFMIADQKQG